MVCYIISFEKTGAFYDDLYNEIMEYDLWAQLTADTWAVSCDMSAQEVFDDLWQHMDEDDRLMVVQSGGICSWNNLHCDDDWLQDNL